MMPYNQRTWKDAFQLSEKSQQRGFLLQCASVSRLISGIQPALITDADGVPIVIEAMRPDFLRRTTPVNLTVAGHIEMITDVTETAVPNVVAAAILKAQAHALRRGRAMNNEQRNRAHSYLQEPNPKAPAIAVATVMITLRTMPHTDFDFLSSFMTA